MIDGCNFEVLNTSYGGVIQECLPTEPGDDGTKLEGG